MASPFGAREPAQVCHKCQYAYAYLSPNPTMARQSIEDLELRPLLGYLTTAEPMVFGCAGRASVG